MTVPGVNAELSTNVKFNELSDADHHTGISPLKELSVGMVTQFPLDYTHFAWCVCLYLTIRTCASCQAVSRCLLVAFRLFCVSRSAYRFLRDMCLTLPHISYLHQLSSCFTQNSTTLTGENDKCTRVYSYLLLLLTSSRHIYTATVTQQFSTHTTHHREQHTTIHYTVTMSTLSRQPLPVRNTRYRPFTSATTTVSRHCHHPEFQFNTSSVAASMRQFPVKDEVTRAEIVWALHGVMLHSSVWANSSATDLFHVMFPHSNIAARFKMQKDKKRSYLWTLSIFSTATGFGCQKVCLLCCVIR